MLNQSINLLYASIYLIAYWVICWSAIQEKWQDIRVEGYQEYLTIIEAYNDPRLQPVVVMEKLDESRLVAFVNIFHLYVCLFHYSQNG